MKLEEKLVQLRKDKGLSQMYVAEAMEVSRQAISRWEIGTALPSTDNLRKLAALYEVSVDYLLNESVDTEEKPQRTEAALPPEAPPAERKENKRGTRLIGYAAVSTVLALLFFLGGYMLGRVRTEQMQNEPIPMDEMETMDLDMSDAAIGTYGWPDFGEGGE